MPTSTLLVDSSVTQHPSILKKAALPAEGKKINQLALFGIHFAVTTEGPLGETM